MALLLQFHKYYLSAQRVSIFVPLAFYLILLALSVHFSIPLRSQRENPFEELRKISMMKSKEKMLLSVIKRGEQSNNINDISELKNIPPTELLAAIFMK